MKKRSDHMELEMGKRIMGERDVPSGITNLEKSIFSRTGARKVANRPCAGHRRKSNMNHLHGHG